MLRVISRVSNIRATILLKDMSLTSVKLAVDNLDSSIHAYNKTICITQRMIVYVM